MPQLPTQWAVQQRHLSCTQGVTCVRGRRALLLLVLLHEKGVRAGYMKCCMGSGRPHAERMRATLKRTERVHEGWGMHAMAGFKSRRSASATDRSGSRRTLCSPRASCCLSRARHCRHCLPSDHRTLFFRPAGKEPARVQPTGGSGSCRLFYGSPDEHGDIEESASYQLGAWLARAELSVEAIPELLDSHLLSEYSSDVQAYLDEQYALINEYSPLLMHYGRDGISLSDMPEHFPRRGGRLSITLTDESMMSQFGVHTDTPQLLPFACSTCSVYPPGYYDFLGGEFVWINGVAHVQMDDSTVNIGVGHRALHTVLPLAPRSRIHEQPMVRVSFVVWSVTGAAIPGLVDDHMACRDEDTEFELEAARVLCDAVRCALGVPIETISRQSLPRIAVPLAVAPRDKLVIHDNGLHESASTHRASLGLQLRLRGGARKRSGKCRRVQ